MWRDKDNYVFYYRGRFQVKGSVDLGALSSTMCLTKGYAHEYDHSKPYSPT